MRTLLVVTLLLALAVPAEATVFYDESWENYPVGTVPPNPPYTPGGEQGTTVTISADTALIGTKSLKMVYPTDLSGAGDAFDRTIPTNTHMFGRFGIKIVAGFLTGGNALSKVIMFGAQAGNPVLLLELRSQDAGGGALINSPPNAMQFEIYPFDCLTGTFPEVHHLASPNPNDGQWHQYEVEGLLNDPGVANGLVRVWADNVLIFESLNRQLRGPTPTNTEGCGIDPNFLTPSTTVYTFNEIYRQAGTGTLYLDCVGSGDARLGLCGGVAPPAPANPCCLTVTQLLYYWFLKWLPWSARLVGQYVV